MRGLPGLVGNLLDALGVHLQPWMAPLAIVVLIAVAWPLLRLNIKTDDAQRLLKRASRERGEAREKLEREALELVGDRPDGLVVIANTAIELGRMALARQAMERLRATGKNLPTLRRIERAIDGPQPATALEAALVVERLVKAGMMDEAQERLRRFKERWPDDPELRDLGESDGAPTP